MEAVDTTSFADPPFHAPPDVVLDLPPAPSVNKTRKVDWAHHRTMTAWRNVADAYVLAAKGRSVSPLKLTRIARFELLIIIDEHKNRIDLDNGLKALIDYLRRIELIEDDSPKHMRRLVVEWGLAPFGCRVRLRPCP